MLGLESVVITCVLSDVPWSVDLLKDDDLSASHPMGKKMYYAVITVHCAASFNTFQQLCLSGFERFLGLWLGLGRVIIGRFG